MPRCKKKRRVDTKVCFGDMDSRILVQLRQIAPPGDDGVDYHENFTVEELFWALVETVSGETVFDGNNVEQVVTHKFYIHYAPGLTFENWVLFNSRRYQIIDVSNLNERNEFYVIRCNMRGDAAVVATGN